MTISNSNSFDLFSYGSESVFWYFQFQRLISDFSDNPLKLHKIPAYYLKNPLKLHKIPAYYLKFSQTEIYVFHFAKKARFVRFGVNGTTFLQDIQRKKSKQKGGKKKKVGKKNKRKKKCQTKKCPALLILLYFLPLITGPYDLTIASVVSVLGFCKGSKFCFMGENIIFFPGRIVFSRLLLCFVA